MRSVSCFSTLLALTKLVVELVYRLSNFLAASGASLYAPSTTSKQVGLHITDGYVHLGSLAKEAPANSCSPGMRHVAQIWGIFRGGDINKYEANYDFLHFDVGWGTSRWMMDNPWLRERIFQMGIRPTIAFGCALDFLVEPSAPVREMFAKEIEVRVLMKRAVPSRIACC
jgi:hypothetical protein